MMTSEHESDLIQRCLSWKMHVEHLLMNAVVKTTVFLTDLRDYDSVNCTFEKRMASIILFELLL